MGMGSWKGTGYKGRTIGCPKRWWKQFLQNLENRSATGPSTTVPPEPCQQGEGVKPAFPVRTREAFGMLGPALDPPKKEQLDILEIFYLRLMILAYKHLSC